MCYAGADIYLCFHRKRKAVGFFQGNKNQTWQRKTSWRPWWQRRKGRLMNRIHNVYVVVFIGYKFLMTCYYIPSFEIAYIQSYIAVWLCDQTNLKKGNHLSLLIFIDQYVHPAWSMWMSLQNYMLLLSFVYCRMKEEKDSPVKIHSLGCWDSGTFHSSSLFDSTSTTSKLFPLKTCFQDFSRTASSPSIQPFKLL